jgi:hypothetical protein
MAKKFIKKPHTSLKMRQERAGNIQCKTGGLKAQKNTSPSAPKPKQNLHKIAG